jgi:geranylgeranyl pyrophosphate synthase
MQDRTPAGDWQPAFRNAWKACCEESCRRQARTARLHEAMHYAALGEGKRIRPLLVYATGSAIGVRLTLDRRQRLSS